MCCSSRFFFPTITHEQSVLLGRIPRGPDFLQIVRASTLLSRVGDDVLDEIQRDPVYLYKNTGPTIKERLAILSVSVLLTLFPFFFYLKMSQYGSSSFNILGNNCSFAGGNPEENNGSSLSEDHPEENNEFSLVCALALGVMPLVAFVCSFFIWPETLFLGKRELGAACLACTEGRPFQGSLPVEEGITSVMPV